MKNKLLLIFGIPRSGTTWLGKLFDSSPDILYLHEPDSQFKINAVPLLVTSEKYAQYTEQVLQYKKKLLDHCTVRINGKTPFFKKSYLTSLSFQFFQFNVLIAKVIEKIDISIPIWNPFKQQFKDVIVAWKSIESCGRVGLLINSLPDSKMVFIIRHPCGQIASVIRGEDAGDFISKDKTSEDYQLIESLLHSDYAVKNKLTIDTIKAMQPIERLAIRWVLYNEQAIEDVEKVTKKGIIIRYEDLYNDPEK